jgi:hypothetical protein
MAAGFSVDIPGEKPLLVSRAEFREAQVFQESSGGYLLNALVDAEGDMGGTHVSYLGIEKIPFVREGSAWHPKSPILPALQGILAVLRARDQATAARDVGAFRDRLVGADYKDGAVDRSAYLARLVVRFQSIRALTHPTKWAIRVDRGEAQVFEEATSATAGSLSRRSRYTLSHEDGLWRFTSGLD